MLFGSIALLFGSKICNFCSRKKYRFRCMAWIEQFKISATPCGFLFAVI